MKFCKPRFVDFASPLALLNLPSRHIAVNEQVPLFGDKGCARANYEGEARCLAQTISLFCQLATRPGIRGARTCP